MTIDLLVFIQYTKNKCPNCPLTNCLQHYISIHVNIFTFSSHTHAGLLTFQVTLRLNNMKPRLVIILHLATLAQQQPQSSCLLKHRLSLHPVENYGTFAMAKNSQCLVRSFKGWVQTQAFPISSLHLTEINLAPLSQGTRSSLQLSSYTHENSRTEQEISLDCSLCSALSSTWATASSPELSVLPRIWIKELIESPEAKINHSKPFPTCSSWKADFQWGYVDLQ